MKIITLGPKLHYIISREKMQQDTIHARKSYRNVHAADLLIENIV